MRFHFLLTNHYPFGCYRLEDVLGPIAAGLAELGHKVTYGFDDDVPPWPAVNLLVENFNDPAVLDQVDRLRRGRERYCFGLVAYEDAQDAEVMDHPDFPRRGRNLERALKAVDFAWTTVPCDYGGLAGGARVRFVEYGYAAALRREPAAVRDIDVLFYGDLGPRRVPMFNALAARGLRVDATLGLLPEYLKLDLLRRARIVVEVRRSEAARFLTPARIVAALHAGATVVAEQHDRSALAALYRYTLATEPARFLDVCAAAARSDEALGFGAIAREGFARERSMAASLRGVMTGPPFDELAAA